MMFEKGVLSLTTIANAGLALILVYLWNVTGRFVDRTKIGATPPPKEHRTAHFLGAFVQTIVFTVLMACIAFMLISGIITNPTNFRYAGF